MGSGEAGQAQETNLGADTQETDRGSGGVRSDQNQDTFEGLWILRIFMLCAEKEFDNAHSVVRRVKDVKKKWYKNTTILNLVFC